MKWLKKLLEAVHTRIVAGLVVAILLVAAPKGKYMDLIITSWFIAFISAMGQKYAITREKGKSC